MRGRTQPGDLPALRHPLLPRRQLAGPREVAAALEAGEPLRLLLVAAHGLAPEVEAVLERARERGVPVRTASAATLWRLSKTDPPAQLLGLVGGDPRAGLDAVLAGDAPVWLLVGVAYPGNAGFAVRAAEVSGAGGIVIDSRFERPARRETLRAAMRADWFFPVLWERADATLARARAAGRRLVAIEDVGTRAPWETDLTGRLLLVVGGERLGLAPECLARCDEVVRLPMAGFIPSYNLQAAMAAVAIERLRQLSQ
jgi:TrmH family RNA methyltransferase